MLTWYITVMYVRRLLIIGGGKGGAMKLQPQLILRVLHSISFFTIEIFSCLSVSLAHLVWLPYAGYIWRGKALANLANSWWFLPSKCLCFTIQIAFKSKFANINFTIQNVNSPIFYPFKYFPRTVPSSANVADVTLKCWRINGNKFSWMILP